MDNDTEGGETMAGKFISPNDALANAKRAMLEDRDPVSFEDWAAIFACFAVNLDGPIEMFLVLRTILDAPLTDNEVGQIVAGAVLLSILA